MSFENNTIELTYPVLLNAIKNLEDEKFAELKDWMRGERQRRLDAERKTLVLDAYHAVERCLLTPYLFDEDAREYFDAVLNVIGSKFKKEIV